jgi:CTP:molybdopterin cytidylyltransferase MocA
MARVAAIVLAAGASLRFGSPKQLITLCGETLVERTVRVASEAGLDPILGVVSPQFPLANTPSGMTAVINHAALEGMATSIKCGLQALQNTTASLSGAIILACDQPSVTVDHLQHLALGGSDVLASAYAGRKGIPAYFPAGTFAQLFTLRGDTGARELLKNAKALDLPAGELDIDTIEDLQTARLLYERDAEDHRKSPLPKQL